MGGAQEGGARGGVEGGAGIRVMFAGFFKILWRSDDSLMTRVRRGGGVSPSISERFFRILEETEESHEDSWNIEAIR